MIWQIKDLQDFRKSLYQEFPKRRDAILNLLDALSSYGHCCNSVVQLSKAECYERQYSSITDAIADGLKDVDWGMMMKLVYAAAATERNILNRFIMDCSSNPRPYAQRLADRTVTHLPNPAPGNKPICVGHQYSLLALLPNDTLVNQKHWLVPLAAKRVTSQEKGNEIGVQQVVDSINELGLSEQLSLSIGDSLYGTEQCRITVSKQENLIHLFRLNSKRNVFCRPAEKSASIGRKKEFGNKMTLNNPESHPEFDEEAETTWTSRRNKEYKVKIQCWRNMLLRGSRGFRSSEYPVNVIKVCVFDQQGKMIFKRPMWLAVMGKYRDELSLVDCYHNYSNRYDIEHLFRFGKQKLLLDAYQTPDSEHEENWWNLCLLAYMQLYLGKELAPLLPEAWERYLPEFKTPEIKSRTITTPSQTQRGFSKILAQIGTPAEPCVARGNPRGRMLGEIISKREQNPVIFKHSKPPKKTAEIVIPESGEIVDFSNPKKMAELVKIVRSTLESLQFSTDEFVKKLADSG